MNALTGHHGFFTPYAQIIVGKELLFLTRTGCVVSPFLTEEKQGATRKQPIFLRLLASDDHPHTYKS